MNPNPTNLPEINAGGITPMLISELFNTSPRVYKVLERLLSGDPEGALVYLQREIATKNGQ